MKNNSKKVVRYISLQQKYLYASKAKRAANNWNKTLIALNERRRFKLKRVISLVRKMKKFKKTE